MKKYFLYELKKSAFATGCLTLVATIIYLTTLLSARNIGFNDSYIYLWIISAIGGVLAAAVPVWVFSYKMKKRSVDLYYSLPLPHTQILAVKFFIGLIAVFAPYTVAYWLGAFTAMARAAFPIHAAYYAAHYFASLIPVYIIFAISAFVFTRANKTGDGIVFIVFRAFALTAAVGVLEIIVEQSKGVYFAPKIFPTMFAPYKPLDIATTAFQEFITGDSYILRGAELVNFAVGTAVNALLAAGATAGLFLYERQTKAENCEQVSDSIFGYKTMIPLFTLCLAAITYMQIILIVLIAAAAYGLTAIYRRTLKIGQTQAIVLIVSLVAGIIISAVCTYAF